MTAIPVARHEGENANRRAIVVRGGWDGHDPIGTTELFIPLLVEDGFSVDVYETLDVYTDQAVMAQVDLIVACWSMGVLTEAQERGLVEAVEGGAGFGGWHGGIVATNIPNLGYLRMVGGSFLWHPSDFLAYPVTIVGDHPITAGIESIDVYSEEYWLLSDSHNTVLATSTFEAAEGSPWSEPVTMPVVWTRSWGKGHVFVCTLGHRIEDLTGDVTTIIRRGLSWASR